MRKERERKNGRGIWDEVFNCSLECFSFFLYFKINLFGKIFCKIIILRLKKLENFVYYSFFLDIYNVYKNVKSVGKFCIREICLILVFLE